jgi:hypothetical protein
LFHLSVASLKWRVAYFRQYQHVPGFPQLSFFVRPYAVCAVNLGPPCADRGIALPGSITAPPALFSLVALCVSQVVWGQFDCGRVPGWKMDAAGRIFANMAQSYRPPLLEVRVIPLKPDRWEWQVCDDDTPIVVGYETTRKTAQIKGDNALFLLLSKG